MNRLTPLAAGFALLSLVGCGPNDAGRSADGPPRAETAARTNDVAEQPAATAPNPCELLTPDVAQQALGAEVKAPREDVSDAGLTPGRRCTYFTSAPIQEAGGTGSVRLRVVDAALLEGNGLFGSPQKLFEREYEAHKGTGAEIEDVAGVGDRAYWLAGSDTLRALVQGVYVAVEIKDLTKLSAPTRAELNAKISAHRRDASVALMRDHVLLKMQTGS